MTELPIHDIRDDLVRELSASNRVVLTAPTGSGKSTQVPQFLLDRCGVEGRVLVLQPRRLAARMLAGRVAWERDGRVGDEVGFQTRFESALSRVTRISFITDGILPRLLLGDRRLDGVGAVVFDEFHERSLNGDIGLGATRRLQETLRPDLKIVIMSATLEARSAADHLGGCACLHAEGRRYPVEVSYAPPRARQPVWESAAKALADLLRRGAEGDVLVFMPGAYEIWRTIEEMRRARLPERVDSLPLYGDLAPRRQDEVMSPSAHRKVIVATNIAETSLTIPGVRHVIDSGLARISRQDPARGFNMLTLEAISRSSSEQRTGRAGREAPGTCCRLWSLGEQQRRPSQTDPEVKRVDLAEALLLLKSLGFDEPADFPWPDAPPPAALESAVELLVVLGALGRDGHGLTALGERLARTPTHPRLARLMRDADEHGSFDEAAMIAAILSERPLPLPGKDKGVLRKAVRNTLTPAAGQRPDARTDPVQSDFFALINALRSSHAAGFDPDGCRRLGISASAARQVWRSYEFFARVGQRQGLGRRPGAPDAPSLIKSLLAAFPDRLARRRDGGTLACALSDGRRAELARVSTVRDSALLVAGEVRETAVPGQSPKALLSLASEVREAWLRECFPDDWSETEETVWDDKRRQVVKQRRVLCLGVTLEESVSADVDPEAAAAMLAGKIRDGALVLRGWTREVDAWLTRVRWVAGVFPERGLIEYDETDMDVILREFCAGASRYKQIKDKPLLDAARNALSWEDQRFVESMAPERLGLPCGRRLRLEYRPGEAVRGKARVQDLYDLTQTPRVAGGREKVLLEILAPNMRTVQVTDDLAGFWRDTYPSVRKELCRRYPKHEWR